MLIHKLNIALLLVALCRTLHLDAQIVINEVSYVNEIASEEEGLKSDWIELYNPNDHSVSLLGWHLSDDADELDKFNFPDTTIAPYGILVVYATGSETTLNSALCAPFQIANGAEHVFLTRANGSLCAALMAITTLETGSYGRFPDGGSQWYHMGHASPHSRNASEFIVYPNTSALLDVSHASGFYNTAFQLTATSADEETEIHYTTTGEIPQQSDPVLTSALSIAAEERSSTGIAYIPTSDSWRSPSGSVAKYQIVRLRPFKNGIPVGNTQTYTYLVHPHIHSKYPCPVVSIVLPDSALFDDDKGIYVPGNSTYGNFAYKGKAWERAAHLAIMSNSGGLAVSSDARLRIHGRSSRFSPQKNLRIYGPEVFQDETLPLADLRPTTDQDDYKSVILRAPEPLFSTSLFTGQLAQRLVHDLNFESPHNRAGVTLINGYYWGVHHIEERIDKHFLAQHTGADPDALDLIDWDRGLTVVEGNMDAYNALFALIENHDLSQAHHYLELSEQLDIESFIDYISAQVFFANEDFGINNVRLWRAHAAGSKWRFIFFDGDATMRQHWQNRLEDLLMPTDKDDPVHRIFGALAKNQDFIRQFYSRFIYLLNTIFTPNNLLDHLEQFVAQHKPLVMDHVRRWHRPESFAEWENAISQIRQFMLLRPALMTDYLNQKFKLPFTMYPNPCHSNTTILFHSTPHSNSLSMESLFEIVVRTAAGQTVACEIDYGIDRAIIPTANLASGLYLVEIRMPMMTYTHRMIVQH